MNEYKYNDDVENSEYLSINLNLKNKFVLTILLIIAIGLIFLLLNQIFKYSNSVSKGFNTGKCDISSNSIPDDQLINIILHEQLS